MKIAVVVTGGLHPSGREQVVPSWLALFSRLSAHHEIHAFALRHLPEAQTYTLNGFHVHDLGRPSAPLGLTRTAQEQALHRAITAHGPFDLIHGLWGDPAGRLAVRLGRELDVPSVVTFDSGEFVSLPEIGYGSQRTSLGRQAIADACAATRAHVCSYFMADLAAKHGVKTPAIIPLTTVSGTPIERTRRSGRRFCVLAVASLSRVKNQKLLIETLPRLKDYMEVQVDLVGEDTLSGELQQHARQLGVAGRVRFHGFQPQDKLPEFYAAADLYVQTSLHEAAGVSVLEAAAAGVPVAGTMRGYVADWATDRARGVMRDEPEHLAAAIIAAFFDRDQPGGPGELATQMAMEWSRAHDVAVMVARFDELYAATVRSYRRGQR
jgi:glycosyltransferase involved in cell wall biosynthesis